MKLTVTLHCEGALTGRPECPNTVSATANTAQRTPTIAIDQVARQAGWDVRPVGVGAGEIIQARCPVCAEALSTLAATQLETDNT